MSVMRPSFGEILAACYKGGGGGGGSSGKTDYPDYMKTVHSNWLAGEGASLLPANKSITALLDNALEVSPYEGETAYDPDSDIALFVDNLSALGAELDAAGTWEDYIDTIGSKIDTDVYSEAQITAVTNAHAAVLDDRLTTDVLPRFQAGMRDINAVVSSSFVTGQAILEAFNTREVAEFDVKLRMQNYGQRQELLSRGVADSLQILQMKLEFSKITIEAMRIKVVMKKEELDEQLDMEEKDYTWGMGLFQHASNVMSSIAGSAISTQKTPSKGTSVLGGALSGAASGAAMTGGNPIGAGIGAIVGAGMSLM